MRRRDLLTLSSAAGAATLGGLAAPAIAQRRFEWSMLSPWPKGAPGVGDSAQRAADMITVLSDGRLTVKLFAAGERAPPFGLLDAVGRGDAEMLHGTPYYWQGKPLSFQWFTGLPLGFTAAEHMGWLWFGGGQALWDELYAPFGIKPFYAGSSGVQAGGWSTKELLRLDDLKGLRFRIAGLGGEVLKRLGATVVLTPPGEIVAALQQGTLDAAEWVSPWGDLNAGLHRAARYYYLPAFHEPGPALELSVNKGKFDGLPRDLQEIVAAAARATAATTIADFAYHNAASMEALGAAGVELRRWPEEIVAALGPATRDVLDAAAAADPFARRVHASFTAHLAQARAWARWSDLPLLDMRERALG